MKISAKLGYKLFHVNEDNSVSLIRIMDMKKYKDNADPVEITIRDEDTKETKKVNAKTKKIDTSKYEYKWSRETELAGWTRTGKTRTVDGEEICK